MSRLAKKPIKIPSGVKIGQAGEALMVKGQKGELLVSILPSIKVEILNEALIIKPAINDQRVKVNSGTMWSLLRNAIEGVNEGFYKVLEIEGVGYRANLDGNTLVLSLGYANPVRFNPPSGIEIAVEKNSIRVSGIDKQLVGQTAAEIRAFKKPEPYKGKGIRYRGEIIRRKAGKKATGATTG